MAKIYGVQLKAVKQHLTSDGYAIYGNVYLNNKKVGTIHDDGVGAGMWANFISKEVEEELINIAKKFYETYPTYVINEDIDDFGILINFLEEELLLLHDIEKEFKDNTKKGFPLTLYLQSHTRKEDPFNNGIPYQTPLIVGVKDWEPKTEKHIEADYPNYKDIRFYEELSHFIIE